MLLDIGGHRPSDGLGPRKTVPPAQRIDRVQLLIRYRHNRPHHVIIHRHQTPWKRGDHGKSGSREGLEEHVVRERRGEEAARGHTDRDVCQRPPQDRRAVAEAQPVMTSVPT